MGMVTPPLRHRVASCGFTEPVGARLGRPFLRLESQRARSEAVAVAGVPLEIVHRAPLEVPLHGHAVGGRPLKLRQVG
jgi:hypothetical protein